jgi:hypothetical protein
MLRGSCLCRAIAFTAGPPEGRAIACHCNECRRQSGHHFAAVPVAKAGVVFKREASMTWYRASDIGTRGFCALCGSTLFWRDDDGPHLHVLMGSLDGATGLHLGAHVWVREKGDYYDIGGDLPQFWEG